MPLRNPTFSDTLAPYSMHTASHAHTFGDRRVVRETILSTIAAVGRKGQKDRNESE